MLTVNILVLVHMMIYSVYNLGYKGSSKAGPKFIPKTNNSVMKVSSTLPVLLVLSVGNGLP